MRFFKDYRHLKLVKVLASLNNFIFCHPLILAKRAFNNDILTEVLIKFDLVHYNGTIFTFSFFGSVHEVVRAKLI